MSLKLNMQGSVGYYQTKLLCGGGQVENAEVQKLKYGNGTTEVRRNTLRPLNETPRPLNLRHSVQS